MRIWLLLPRYVLVTQSRLQKWSVQSMMCSASTIAAAFFEYLPDLGERAKAIQLAMCRKLHSMDSFEDACKI